MEPGAQPRRRFYPARFGIEEEPEEGASCQAEPAVPGFSPSVPATLIPSQALPFSAPRALAVPSVSTPWQFIGSEPSLPTRGVQASKTHPDAQEAQQARFTAVSPSAGRSREGPSGPLEPAGLGAGVSHNAGATRDDQMPASEQAFVLPWEIQEAFDAGDSGALGAFKSKEDGPRAAGEAFNGGLRIQDIQELLQWDSSNPVAQDMPMLTVPDEPLPESAIGQAFSGQTPTAQGMSGQPATWQPGDAKALEKELELPTRRLPGVMPVAEAGAGMQTRGEHRYGGSISGSHAESSAGTQQGSTTGMAGKVCRPGKPREAAPPSLSERLAAAIHSIQSSQGGSGDLYRPDSSPYYNMAAIHGRYTQARMNLGPQSPPATQPAGREPLVKRVRSSEGSSGDGPTPPGEGPHTLAPGHTGRTASDREPHGLPLGHIDKVASGEQSSIECDRPGDSPNGPCRCTWEQPRGNECRGGEDANPSHSHSHNQTHNHSQGCAHSLGRTSSQSYSNASMGSQVTVHRKRPVPIAEGVDASAFVHGGGSGLLNGTSWHANGASWPTGTGAHSRSLAKGTPGWRIESVRLADETSAMGGAELAMKQRLLVAARALDQGDTKLFQNVYEHLKTFARPQGRALERVVHSMLHALLLKMQGSAFAYANAPYKKGVHELIEARKWYCRSSPLAAFGSLAITGSILPTLMGKSSVHIIDVGATMMFQWPTVVKMLAASGVPQKGGGGFPGAGGCVGAGVARGVQSLKRLRITQVNVMPLAFPGRADYKTMASPPEAIAALYSAASSLGVELTIARVVLDDSNLEALDRIERGEDEVVAFTCAYDFKFMADDPMVAGGPLPRLFKALARLKPEVLSIVEEEMGKSGQPLVPRLAAVIDYSVALFSSHDAIVQGRRKRELHLAEKNYFWINSVSVVGCDPLERRVRPHSSEEWRDLFELYGFVPLPLGPLAVSSLQEMLNHFPKGYGIRSEEGAARLTWKGSPIICCCSFTSGRPECGLFATPT